MRISPIRLIPAAVAIAGAALVGVAAQPAAAAPTTDTAVASPGGRSGPYGPEECDDMRWTAMHYGYKVSQCYPWYPTYPGNPGGGYWFDYWI